jgi:hypothetical protein
VVAGGVGQSGSYNETGEEHDRENDQAKPQEVNKRADAKRESDDYGCDK